MAMLVLNEIIHKTWGDSPNVLPGPFPVPTAEVSCCVLARTSQYSHFGWRCSCEATVECAASYNRAAIVRMLAMPSVFRTINTTACDSLTNLE